MDSSWEINFEARFCSRKVISSALLFPAVPRAPGREQTTVLGDEKPDLGASPCSFPRAKMVSEVLSLERLYLGSTCYTGCVTLGGLVPLCDNCQPLSRRHQCGFLKIRGKWTGWVSLMMCPWGLESECKSQCFPGRVEGEGWERGVEAGVHSEKGTGPAEEIGACWSRGGRVEERLGCPRSKFICAWLKRENLV